MMAFNGLSVDYIPFKPIITWFSMGTPQQTEMLASHRLMFNGDQVNYTHFTQRQAVITQNVTSFDRVSNDTFPRRLVPLESIDAIWDFRNCFIILGLVLENTITYIQHTLTPPVTIKHLM